MARRVFKSKPDRWPTPRAGDSKQGPSSVEKHLKTGDVMLSDAALLWDERFGNDETVLAGATVYRATVAFLHFSRQAPDDARANVEECLRLASKERDVPPLVLRTLAAAFLAGHPLTVRCVEAFLSGVPTRPCASGCGCPVPQRRRGRPRLFCSNACRQREYRNGVTESEAAEPPRAQH